MFPLQPVLLRVRLPRREQPEKLIIGGTAGTSPGAGHARGTGDRAVEIVTPAGLADLEGGKVDENAAPSSPHLEWPGLPAGKAEAMAAAEAAKKAAADKKAAAKAVKDAEAAAKAAAEKAATPAPEAAPAA